MTVRIRIIWAFASGMFTGIIFVYSLSYIDDYSMRRIYRLTHSWPSPVNNSFSQNESHRNENDCREKIQWHDNEDESHTRENDFIAAELKKQVRVLCWIMTSPKTLATKALHINATWGQRCNILLFMSSKSSVSIQTTLPVVELDVPEGHEVLWAKTKAAFRYIYDHHLHDADWVLKADDDTFAIVENLRYLLKDHNPDEPKFFGRRFKSPQSANYTYMSGGAGYVLSREAVRLFATIGLGNPEFCSVGDKANEDVEIGECLCKCGVEFIDTRDKLGRQRFHPLSAITHLINGSHGKDFWFWYYDYYPSQNGSDCCSDYTVTFHYVEPNYMYLMEYLIYHVKPYGIGINYDQRETHRRTTTSHSLTKKASL